MPIIQIKGAVAKKLADRKVREGSNRLRKFAKNVFSQMGEDGILKEIFDTIGSKSKWCVEFGAMDGVYLSNTRNLIINDNWSAVLIEGNETRGSQIRSNYPDRADVFPISAMVGFKGGTNTIDELLSATPIPRDFDLISIDVDGNDWHIWDSIVDYRPRVVAIEFNPKPPNDVIFVQDADMRISEGCSLAAAIELGKSKGYELIGVSFSNSFFVVKEEFDKFGIADNSIHSMRVDRPNFIWDCYNGKIYHTMQSMNWGEGRLAELRPDSLQFLTKFSYKGQHQGKAHTKEERRLAQFKDEIELQTADGILTELLRLRSSRREMPTEEFTRRNKAALSAAIDYVRNLKE